MKKTTKILLIQILFFSLLTTNLFAARIKDLSAIKGIRTNQLIGYGLVVGLNGTGDNDKTKFTMQALANMMSAMGVSINKDDVEVANVAAVMVTAQMPPFSRIGNKLDITVSSIGDAKSLDGGTLILTPLKGVDGKIYALAQGSISLGGYDAGKGKMQKYQLVGRILNGATIEKEIPISLNGKRELLLSLYNPDFTTASRVALAIDKIMGENTAKVVDSGAIALKVPDKFLGNVANFLADIEKLNVDPDTYAKVVVNEKTGTVVMGENVKLSSLAIAHGNISIKIAQKDGETSSRKKDEKFEKAFVLPEATTIGDLVKVLNAIGISPKDLISIFQTIKASGALQADLEII